MLNTERQQWKCQMEGISPTDELGYTFDPKVVSYLGEILNVTGAEIVLSSSWKFLGMSVLKDMWQARHLPGTITDITPDNQEGKGLEIKEWLEKRENEIENHVILDDEDDVFTCVSPSPVTVIGFIISMEKSLLTRWMKKGLFDMHHGNLLMICRNSRTW